MTITAPPTSTDGRCARGSSDSTCTSRSGASPLPGSTPSRSPSWPIATVIPTPVRNPTSTVRERKFARNPTPTTRASTSSTATTSATVPANAT